MRHGADTVEKERVPDRYREDDEERPCDHCDFQEIEARQAAAVMGAVKKERERILGELDYIKHVESKDEFFVTVYLFEVRKIVRGES